MMEPSKWVEISLLPGGTGSHGSLRLDLEVSSIWVPEKVTGSEDRREMGVAIERIWFDDVDSP